MSKNQTHTKQMARALAAHTGVPYTRARKIVVAATEAGLLPGPFTPEAMPALVDVLCSPVVAALMQPTDAPETITTPEVGENPPLEEPAVDWSRVMRVKFPETGERWWTVRALHGDFVVVTQQVPFEKKGILRYSVLDLQQGVRGPCNLVGQGWSGIDTDRGCRTLARAMSLGVVSVSGRNNVLIRPVTIEWATAVPVNETVGATPLGGLVADAVVKSLGGRTNVGTPQPTVVWQEESDRNVRLRVSKSDVAFVFRRVSVMLNSFVSLPEAFAAAARSTSQTLLQDVCVRIAKESTSELEVADVLGDYPDLFDEFVIAVVRSGAQSQSLGRAMRSIADTFDAEPAKILVGGPSLNPFL